MRVSGRRKRMEGLMQTTCGTCEWAVKPDNMIVGQVERVCYGAPPTPMLVPQGPGRVALTAQYPVVTITTRGCGSHKLAETPLL